MLPWEKNIEYVAKAFVKKNLWRVKGLGYEFNDLLNDAYLEYAKCANHYHAVRAKHFKNLYKKCLKNMINKLSNGVTEKFANTVELDNERMNGVIEKNREQNIEEEILFRLRFSQAPKEVKQAIHLMINPPEELLELFRDNKYSKDFKNNRLLCKMLNISNPNKMNIVSDVKDFLRGV